VQLLQDNQLCACLGQLANLRSQMEYVGFYVLSVVLLYDSNLHGLGFLKTVQSYKIK
jgi:hypothetical protein